MQVNNHDPGMVNGWWGTADFPLPTTQGGFISDRDRPRMGHWETQMSFQVGMPKVLSSLSPWIFDPWAWATPP
jgi:hypothetical protein